MSYQDVRHWYEEQDDDDLRSETACPPLDDDPWPDAAEITRIQAERDAELAAEFAVLPSPNCEDCGAALTACDTCGSSICLACEQKMYEDYKAPMEREQP